MVQAPFDPSKEVTFDLEHGSVHLDDAPSRVLVPADALMVLATAAGSEAAVTFARALGEPIGRRVAHRLGHDGEDTGAGARSATVDLLVDHLGGELALAGLGALSLERWGKALVLVVDHSPLGAEGDLFLATVLAAALYRVTAREVYCWPLARDRTRLRVLVAGQDAVARARAWLDEGLSWGDVLAKLHDPASGAERGAA